MNLVSFVVLFIAVSLVLPYSTLLNWLKEGFISLNRPNIETPAAKQYFLDWNGKKQLNWLMTHQSQCRNSADMETILIGDSITEQWNSVGKATWETLKTQVRFDIF